MQHPLLAVLCASLIFAQEPVQERPRAETPKGPPDPIAGLVGRLELERYKATIKGLTQFGDRRQGTDRNRAAIDWIEAQLKSYGCTNTERVHYDYQPPAGAGVVDAARAAGGARRIRTSDREARGGAGCACRRA